MSAQPLYRLADHTAVEPLIDKWVAWPHTFSPVPYSLHLLNYQRKVLISYLQNPAIHVKSCRNPKLLGGPFVDIPEDRADEVRKMLTAIEQNHRDLIDLATGLTEFQNMLAREAKGQSLEPYYEHLPRSLRGYVELVYDYHNRPLVRCIESLLYESPHYKREIQSFRIFAQERDDSRSYYMSTPRLAGPGDIEWIMPFDAPEVDELYALDVRPQPLGHIREVLGVTRDDGVRLPPLLSSEPLALTKRWEGAGIRLRYFGHACVLLEWRGVSILTDPFIPVLPEQGGIERFSFEDLPTRIDYVLITHGHHDHFVFESLLRLRHRIGTLVVPRGSGIFYGDTSLKLLARKLGFRYVQEVDALDSIPVPGGEIIAIPFLGEHCDLPHAKTAYVVRSGNEQILFAADSCCLDKQIYEHITNLLGPIRTVFIGMECIGAPLTWVYAPLLPIKPEHGHGQSRRSHAGDAAAALDLLLAVKAQRVYIYALGREPWLKHFLALDPTENDPYMHEIRKLLEAVRVQGFLDARLLFGRKDLYLEGAAATRKQLCRGEA
ncbi:MAG: MBL fold metallo-hydrolase [Gammaproteobacteria bacterium]